LIPKKGIDLRESRELKRGMRIVRVLAVSEAKFRFYAALRAAGITKSELARAG
jgi:hypothetical protein